MSLCWRGSIQVVKCWYSGNNYWMAVIQTWMHKKYEHRDTEDSWRGMYGIVSEDIDLLT